MLTECQQFCLKEKMSKNQYDQSQYWNIGEYKMKTQNKNIFDNPNKNSSYKQIHLLDI